MGYVLLNYGRDGMSVVHLLLFIEVCVSKDMRSDQIITRITGRYDMGQWHAIINTT